MVHHPRLEQKRGCLLPLQTYMQTHFTLLGDYFNKKQTKAAKVCFISMIHQTDNDSHSQ